MAISLGLKAVKELSLALQIPNSISLILLYSSLSYLLSSSSFSVLLTRVCSFLIMRILGRLVSGVPVV